ncbi:1-pyrroline-5-carboxylate dehydrogenase [Planctomycetes bacterium Poly30]|uniref:L-glutamate gamma-semialdehyde dehydrogenase n=1 Tax=Saltatorellus ferox TaxID=2528018 RepID=A0A518ESE2_9BACT|nr:1-pyrroline-5-carboxylate dehydrogenase [Planctomycetes bacterium Poly30]
MTHGVFRVPVPTNEPIQGYAPGSPERASLSAKVASMSKEVPEIPLIIGGEEIRTGNVVEVTMPHNHRHVIAKAHLAGAAEVKKAIDAAEAARHDWDALPWEERAAVLLRAADLLCGPWRDTINASTMIGQSKTCHQAEIDAACEMADFFRYNASYAVQLYQEQPESSAGVWNRLEHRPLDGYVLAITPFNFTSIAGNLPTAPALMGNTAVWKPSHTALLSNYYTMKMLEAAGMPPGVINFLPGDGPTVGNVAIPDHRLGGIHFTGSTRTFQHIWKEIGDNISGYGQYPRIVGETGGKDFVFVHPSACGAREVAVALARGAFEFQGQKCSAASRAYVPKSLWPDVKEHLAEILSEMKMGDVADFSNFIGAVIDDKSFAKLKGAIDRAKDEANVEVVFGGECDDSEGYFIQPTVAVVQDPKHDLMRTEYFGPLLGLYVYDDDRVDETLELCATTSPYALTGAIFADDRYAVRKAVNTLRFAAGNFYINDKPTGAVVGQQPFGGSRASGTNDKAGSILNLLRWVSPRTIKETFAPPTDWRYPFLG